MHTGERGDPDQLLTPSDAATLLAVPEKTLKYWRNARPQCGPDFIRLSRSVVRYRREDIRRYIAEQAATSAAS